jgi:hypothetical protein
MVIEKLKKALDFLITLNSLYIYIFGYIYIASKRKIYPIRYPHNLAAFWRRISLNFFFYKWLIFYNIKSALDVIIGILLSQRAF